eukprot:gnl/MRDRNA2_/MRDRNA2_140623_c0_seq1.p1 gnl/MRDRNA2_/MRDRNA2_140623_c0~~gnl/MRDRNA2_/MRDRNA2_140623_c0_seq1.p1  ORF type:complete len:121 (-),score=8.13 gnl/MRDRNA2_/MRDRNA2_140623_c0_seq1:243-605(-)
MNKDLALKLTCGLGAGYACLTLLFPKTYLMLDDTLQSDDEVDHIRAFGGGPFMVSVGCYLAATSGCDKTKTVMCKSLALSFPVWGAGSVNRVLYKKSLGSKIDLSVCISFFLIHVIALSS